MTDKQKKRIHQKVCACIPVKVINVMLLRPGRPKETTITPSQIPRNQKVKSKNASMCKERYDSSCQLLWKGCAAWHKIKRVKGAEEINNSAELFKGLADWLKTNWEFQARRTEAFTVVLIKVALGEHLRKIFRSGSKQSPWSCDGINDRKREIERLGRLCLKSPWLQSRDLIP